MVCASGTSGSATYAAEPSKPSSSASHKAMITERRGGSASPAIDRPTASAAATPVALSVAPLQMVSPGRLNVQSLPRWS